jgi:hypothetical protein
VRHCYPRASAGAAPAATSLLQEAGLGKLAELVDQRLGEAGPRPGRPVPEVDDFSDAEVDDLLAAMMPAAEAGI